MQLDYLIECYLVYKYRKMHELPWIMIFVSLVRRFANSFYNWRSHEWKSLANQITSDQKILIRGNACIILFHTLKNILREHIIAKKLSMADRR